MTKRIVVEGKGTAFVGKWTIPDNVEKQKEDAEKLGRILDEIKKAQNNEL